MACHQQLLKLQLNIFFPKRSFNNEAELSVKASLRQAARLCPVLGNMHAPLHQLGRCGRASLKEQQQQQGAAAPTTLTSPKARGCEGREFYLTRDTMTCPCP